MAHMEDSRNAYKVSMGRHFRKKPLGRPRHRWEDNIKIYIQEVGWGGMDWIDLAQDSGRRRTLVNAVMNFWVP